MEWHEANIVAAPQVPTFVSSFLSKVVGVRMKEEEGESSQINSEWLDDDDTSEDTPILAPKYLNSGKLVNSPKYARPACFSRPFLEAGWFSALILLIFLFSLLLVKFHSRIHLIRDGGHVKTVTREKQHNLRANYNSIFGL